MAKVTVRGQKASFNLQDGSYKFSHAVKDTTTRYTAAREVVDALRAEKDCESRFLKFTSAAFANAAETSKVSVKGELSLSSAADLIESEFDLK